VASVIFNTFQCFSVRIKMEEQVSRCGDRNLRKWGVFVLETLTEIMCVKKYVNKQMH
jgi:hypothetical protein